jgi:pyrroloquinoline quinone biosynthesis protein B
MLDPGRSAILSCLPFLLLAGLLGCGAPPTDVPTTSAGASLVVLGSAQDGGVPHAGCACPRCELARVDASRRRRGPSLAIVLPGARPWLIDASPDVADQIARLGTTVASGVDRAPVAGVFLTHAHVGHYLGLAQFGREVLHTQDLPVRATPAMAAFLRDNAPWSQLVRLDNIRLEETAPGEDVEIGGDVRIRSFLVPHRDEFADTVAYRIEGPETTVLYVPDTDRWEAWDPPLEARLAGVDVALLDGTFFSLDELPGRAVEEVPHPLVTTTMDRLEPWVRAGGRVVFTHLNHSNPAVDPDSDAAARIRARGFEIARDGTTIDL